MTVEIIVTADDHELKIELEKRLSKLSENGIKPEIHYSMNMSDGEYDYSVLLVY